MSSFDIAPIAFGLPSPVGGAGAPGPRSQAPSAPEESVSVELSVQAQSAGATQGPGGGEFPSIPPVALPATPPIEVMDAVLAAQQAYEGLVAAGHTLQFDIDPHTHRVRVTVVDLHGNPRGQIPPSRALDIATADSKLTEGH